MTLQPVVPLPADPSWPPRLVVAIDTEEEFDWSAGFAQDAHGTRAMAELWRGQDLLERHGVRPVYLADYPILSDDAAVRGLATYVAEGRAEAGVQLHAWVTPPIRETRDRRHSYQCNLDPALEREKLATMGAAFAQVFGAAPTIHKAGRYGIGPATPDILAEQGYRVDLSVCPSFDFSADGGPDFIRARPGLARVGTGGRILSVPTTAGFVGALERFGPELFARTAPRGPARGVLARTRMLELVRLSPEGNGLDELRRLTRKLLAAGERVLTLSFHSPSLLPGCTPYVRTEDDRDRLLACIDGYLRFFRDEIGGTPVTIAELESLVAS